MTRKEFIEQVGIGAAALLIPGCFGACKKTSNSTSTSSSVDFTISVASGALATNGGYLIQNGVIIARTMAGAFIAVSATCTHAGGTLQYASSTNDFTCPVHGAAFDTSGNVINGPASTPLQKYITTLTGTSLRVHS
jgi:cytochrome b6-f complex iron-sulfur subunit